MKRKIYEPVREFERQTSYCPLYLAWRIVDEARDYFRRELIPSPVAHRRDILSHPMGEELADKLARRAEAVFAKQPFWQRKFSYRRSQTAATNRDAILMAMRHWLAGVLAKENPALFNQLPESFKIGMTLPSSGLRPPSPIRWAKDMPEKPSSSGRQSAPCNQSRFTPAVTAFKAGSRVRSHHHKNPRFVHGCELLAI
jgi:hypothetical protein